MKTTLASIKRRIKFGTKILCVENTYRPELNGTVRTVVKAQGNGFFSTLGDSSPGTSKRFWTEYSKAKYTEIVDADTFKMSFGLLEAQSVCLRIVTDKSARSIT